MTRKIKLLASDLDGTFLSTNGSISAENRAAIAKARAANLRVVFVTGRPARWLRTVADAVQHTDLIVGANGAFIADLEIGKVIHRTEVDSTAAQTAVERILRKYPDAQFGIERSFVGMPLAPAKGLAYEEMEVTELSHFEFAVTSGYPGPDWKHHKVPIASIDQLITQPDITKILVKPGAETGWNSDTWLAQIRPLVGELVQVTHASQEIVLTEISSLGVTKAKAVQWLAAEMGLTADEIAAVGDMPNDTEMLDWVGQAWTVANAHPELIDRFPNRLPTNDDHAVAHLISKLIGSDRISD